MLGWKLIGVTRVVYIMFPELGTALGGRDAIPVWDCGFPEPSLTWLHPSRDLPFSICNHPGMELRVSNGSPHVVGAGMAVIVTIRDLTTASTFNWAILYFISLSHTYSAASPHPGCINSSRLICFCRKLSIRSCNVLEIVPITQPCSSSSLNLPTSVSHSSPSSSSQCWSWSEHLRLLRVSPIAFNISRTVFSAFVVFNPTVSSFLISSCYCLIAVPASWTGILAAVVSLSA